MTAAPTVTQGVTMSELRQRAATLHRAGKLAEARPIYAAYLAAQPRDGGMWSNYGSLLRSEGRHDLSILAQEKALELDPAAGRC